MSENTKSGLGEYFREVFDLNKDGKVSVKEVLHTLIPSYAVGIVIIVVDLLVLVAEYRVWDVALQMTDGNVWKSMGFVAVSAVPFYLSQIMWLYPRANWRQQAIALAVGIGGLVTSAMFGLADLSLNYDVVTISRWVIYISMFYVVALLTYGLIDNGFRLHRMKIQAREKARFETERLAVGRDVLKNLRESLAEERALREEFGDDAVRAHLEVMGRGKNKQPQKNTNGKTPALADEANPSTPPSPNQA